MIALRSDGNVRTDPSVTRGMSWRSTTGKVAEHRVTLAVVLLSADGLDFHEISVRLSVNRQVVRRWVERCIASRFDGLGHRPRCGRHPELEHHVWQKLATVVVQAPEKFGWPLARWLVRALAEFLGRQFGWVVSRS